ncbi:MAG TPA: hypothetical protein VGT44_19855 [Ktedonobacteraceae bacterium]|nr:hypothetical protein [Ktedonobacteraceae bacterium]
MQDTQINKFEMVEGTLPGPGQILLESSDRAVATAWGVSIIKQ